MKTTKTVILTIIFSLFSTQVMPKSFTKSELIRHNVQTISKMIKVIQPDLKAKKRNQIARAVYQTSKTFSIDPKIMIAIIATESNFNNNAVSSSGDLSMAQINTKVWNNEFERLGHHKINIRLLKKDPLYALNKMGKILSILKQRHAKNDDKWYAVYHSKTKKHKERYNHKVQDRLRMIASVSN